MSAEQANLWDFAKPDLSRLTEAEREVYEAVEQGPYGAREYARYTQRSPGTVSNLLRRARNRLDTERGQL